MSGKLFLEILFHRPWARVIILTTSFLGASFGILGPLFQKSYIDSLMGLPIELGKHFSPLQLLVYSFICILLSLSFNALTGFLGSYEGLLMQRKLAQRLYEKILSLRIDSLQGKPVGELVSIYATDIPGATILLEQTIPQGASIIFPLTLAPIALVIFFEMPLWPTLLAIFFITAFNLFMAFRQSKYFFMFKKLAADRIGLVTEWIQNIRTLRILGWMRMFEEKIFKARVAETKNRIAMVTNGQAMNAINSSVTFLLNVIAVGSLVYISPKPITTGTLMALLWIVAVFLTRPFRQMPWVFMFVFDGWTSIKRIASILELKNYRPNEESTPFKKLAPLSSDVPLLHIRNLNLTLKQTQILKNISLDIKEGEWIAIVGEVGCGKTSLLLSLLGETSAHFSEFKIGNNDAQNMNLNQLRQFFTFVPQEGFIMSASLRENVSLEYDISKENDPQILGSLAAAQFEFTQENLNEGLDTEIGERGVNLSGGQKQRVSLARVDYVQAPIILLDDCLSALDVNTENKLIQSLIDGKWKGRTRLLATHRLSVLDKVDRVIFMKNGEIKAIGRYQELLSTNEEFKIYTASVAYNDEITQSKIINLNSNMDLSYGEK